MRSTSPLLLFAFLFASPHVALATTYYVGPAGTASAAGTSRDAPSTPAAIVDKLAPGDVVIFLDGVYPTKETTKITKSGTAQAPITFRADEGAIPVFRGPGETPDQGAIEAGADVGFLVFEGLWFENWGSGAIELDWDFKGCHDITMRYNVADSNGRGGFAPYNSDNALIEYNISSRNGYRSDGSWSSNINVWGTSGKVVVRGNVAFHSVDTSSNNSDGNGFIADLTLANTQTLFENNIAFGNGGACIAITDSGNATLIGNTCYNNNKRAPTNDFNFVNTCRSGSVDGVPVNGKGWTFSGLTMRNNLLAGGVKTISSCGGSSYTQQDNVTNASNVFTDPAAGDFRPKAGSAAVDKVAHGTTFATDIGFDPKCIKVETDSAKKHGYSWWTNAPDFDYMKKIGGIKKCWAPRNRPQGSNQELGAYEVSTSGCTTNAECADTDPCTDDSCSPEGECKHAPLSSCGGGGGSGGSGGGAGGAAQSGGAQNRGGDSGSPRGGATGQGGGAQGGSDNSRGGTSNGTSSGGSANGGSANGGSAMASGGSNPAQGGASTVGSGGSAQPGLGGSTSGQAGKPGAAAGSSSGGGDSGGCSYSAPSRSSRGAGVVSLLLALFAVRRRRVRRS
ncbi:MAG TPA: hypothetical protein VFQ35_05355 [Polyangiaceae bacterium]|nr:hypothetical protein [Polyangiaceae bacterium]